MAYWDVALMAGDNELYQREIAAVVTEGIADPQTWADEHRWELASQPGWDDAWASAVAAGNETPGRDPAVITDPMILSAVQSIGV